MKTKTPEVAKKAYQKPSFQTKELFVRLKSGCTKIVVPHQTCRQSSLHF
jgi:hypothetical protein